MKKSCLLTLPMLLLSSSFSANASLPPGRTALTPPGNATGFLLESAVTLPAGHWNTVTNEPTLGCNDQFNVTVPASEAVRMFRLRM
jgi:hypothetical protein